MPVGKRIKTIIIAGLALVVYFTLRQFTGFYIPCFFHLITGLQCPGCGSTRMISALLRLDLRGAYLANPFLLVTSPFILLEIIYEFFLPHKNKTLRRFNNTLLILYCAALIIFGIVRSLK